MKLLDGKLVASALREELKLETAALFAANRRPPGLTVIIAGENPASLSYISSKEKACKEAGYHSEVFRLPSSLHERELLELIQAKNNDTLIDGILVQLPLPPQINEQKIIEAILPEKDVDGFHPVNTGRLLSGLPSFPPCTPAGIMELLKYYEIATSGKHAVIVGRSNIVGKPAAIMLMQKNDFANAVVTVCHSAATDISYYTRQADILIAAIGKPHFITGDMVKEGAVLIDVGINRVESSASPKGYVVTGDIDFQSVAGKASFLTPVPGGVGPLTIAMLLKNTFESYKRRERNG